jgi:hypothetical protein
MTRVTQETVLTLKPLDWLQEKLGDLTPEAYQGLETRIAEQGFTDPIWVWKRDTQDEPIIADGWHRTKIANKLGLTKIPFNYVSGVKTERQLEIWVLSRAADQRNLTTRQLGFVRGELANAKKAEALALKEEADSKENGDLETFPDHNQKRDADPVALTTDEVGEIQSEVAGKFGVSTNTVSTDMASVDGLDYLPPAIAKDIKAGLAIVFDADTTPAKANKLDLRDLGRGGPYTKTGKKRADKRANSPEGAMIALRAIMEKRGVFAPPPDTRAEKEKAKHRFSPGDKVDLPDGTRGSVTREDFNKWKFMEHDTVAEAEASMAYLVGKRLEILRLARSSEMDEVERQLWVQSSVTLHFDATIETMALELYTFFEKNDMRDQIPNLISELSNLHAEKDEKYGS